MNEESAPSIEEYNLSTCDPSRQEAEIEALFQEVGRVPFDLANGPVLRIYLLPWRPTGTCCSLTRRRYVRMRHHSGFWCARSVAAIQLSNAAKNHQRNPPQYADLAEWENDLLESEETREGKKYWRELEASASRPPKLPFEKRPSARSGIRAPTSRVADQF